MKPENDRNKRNNGDHNLLCALCGSAISDTILLNSDIKQRKIRVYILWNDDAETETMSNEDDTASAISDTPALLSVNISFTQVAE